MLQPLTISYNSTKLFKPEIQNPFPNADFTKPKKGGIMKPKTTILTDTPENVLIEGKVPMKHSLSQNKNLEEASLSETQKN